MLHMNSHNYLLLFLFLHSSGYSLISIFINNWNPIVLIHAILYSFIHFIHLIPPNEHDLNSYNKAWSNDRLSSSLSLIPYCSFSRFANPLPNLQLLISAALRSLQSRYLPLQLMIPN